MKKSTAIRNALAKELQAASDAIGQTLTWTAQEQAIIEEICTLLDRESTLLDQFDDAETVSQRVKLSSEARLCGVAATRLLKEIRTEIPAESRTTVKARQAAQARWGAKHA